MKKILIALVLLVAGFLTYVAIQPSEYWVERTTTIAAPADKVFGQVNNLKNLHSWSPWIKAATATPEGPAEGQGAILKWAGGAAGEGTLTVVESRPGEFVSVKVDTTKPTESTGTNDFTLTPDGQNTSVNWSLTGERDFIGKLKSLVSGGNGTLEAELDTGLASLKAAAER